MNATDIQRENITKALVAAGVPAVLAPTASRDVLARITKGEPGVAAVRAVAEDWAAAAPQPQAEPTGPEPTHVRMAREAGKVAPAARTTADRVSAVLAGGNPWCTGNVTHQALVGHLDPDQAARLKREAGK